MTESTSGTSPPHPVPDLFTPLLFLPVHLLPRKGVRCGRPASRDIGPPTRTMTFCANADRQRGTMARRIQRSIKRKGSKIVRQKLSASDDEAGHCLSAKYRAPTGHPVGCPCLCHWQWKLKQAPKDRRGRVKAAMKVAPRLRAGTTKAWHALKHPEKSSNTYSLTTLYLSLLLAALVPTAATARRDMTPTFVEPCVNGQLSIGSQ